MNAFDYFLRGPKAKRVIWQPPLTDLQQEAWVLMQRGLTRMEIAAELGIPYSSAKSRVANLKALGYTV